MKSERCRLSRMGCTRIFLTNELTNKRPGVRSHPYRDLPIVPPIWRLRDDRLDDVPRREVLLLLPVRRLVFDDRRALVPRRVLVERRVVDFELGRLRVVRRVCGIRSHLPFLYFRNVTTSRMLRVQNEQGMELSIPCCPCVITNRVVVLGLFQVLGAEQHFARVRDE